MKAKKKALQKYTAFLLLHKASFTSEKNRIFHPISFFYGRIFFFIKKYSIYTGQCPSLVIILLLFRCKYWQYNCLHVDIYTNEFTELFIYFLFWLTVNNRDITLETFVRLTDLWNFPCGKDGELSFYIESFKVYPVYQSQSQIPQIIMHP